MEKEIVCMFDFGLLNQKIYITDGEKVNLLGTAEYSNLGNALIAFCNNCGVDKIHLFGAEDYMGKIIKDINKINYKNIIVEVN